MVPVPEKAKDEKKGFFGRMAAGLSKTRSNLTDGLSTLLLGKKEIDDDMMEEMGEDFAEDFDHATFNLKPQDS